MKIIEKLISELKPYENNPRNNENAIEYVANSIKEFGFKTPIVIDVDDVIVCGHTSLKAAERIGLEKVPCIVASDLTPDQVNAYRLADNKVSEFSKWDAGKLQREIDELAETFDLKAFGFFDSQAGNVADLFNPENQAQPKEDKPPRKCKWCGHELP